jgi:serine/threonine protein kinase
MGSFGNVYFGLNKDTGEVMAAKQVQVSNIDEINTLKRIKALEVEIDILSRFQHTNIVKYIGSSREEGYFNIFLEYEGGGSIAKLIDKYGNFKENLVRLYSKQILEGLEYLHAHNVIHRDIKGANVLVGPNGVCKLVDFGGAKEIYHKEKGLHSSLNGTPYWMAPEVVRQTGHGRQADIWSFGCTVIEMATGRPPWAERENAFAVFFFIGQTIDPPQYPDEFSEEGKDFLNLIFKRDPKERANVRVLLNHPFITTRLGSQKKTEITELRKCNTFIRDLTSGSRRYTTNEKSKVKINTIANEDENKKPYTDTK